MKLNELLTEDRAVSPVVGVALLIAITVILAAVIGGVVLGLGTGGPETPQAQTNAQFDEATGSVTISHDGGEPLSQDEISIVYDSEAGNSGNATLTEDLTAGSTEDISLDEVYNNGGASEFDNGVTVTVLWEDPDSDSTTVLAEFDT